MPFKARNANYNALRKLNLRERLDAVTDTRMGQTLISMLTPTQAAELFPKYYYNRNPDIGGFLKAIPTSLSAAKQTEYEQQIKNTASGDSAGSNYAAGGYRKKWQKEMDQEQQRSQVTRKGVTPPPQLSPEQRQSFEALKNGDIGINDERMKWLKNVPEDVRKQVGINITKDDKGNERYHYTAPQVGEQDVKENLKSSGSGKFSGKENAVLMMISHREGASHPDTVFGDPKGAPGQGPYAKALGLDVRPLSQRSVAEVLELQKKLTAMTAARGIANGQGTSAVGSGQFVRGTLIENLRRLGIPESEWGKIKYDYDLQKRITLSNFRTYVGDPNADPSSWNTYRLGKQWESFDTSKGFAALKSSEIENVRAASSTKPVDPLTQNYTPQQMAARQREMESSIEAQRLGKLASVTQPGGPVNAAGSVKINQSKDFSQFAMNPGVDNFGGQCGQGARKMAGHMFGYSGFISEGLGGDGTAGSLSHGNPYFQKSGLFNAPRSSNREELTNQAYLDSLPIGTVITSSGGRPGGNNGQGHAQIKIGPNKWASDTVQSHLLVNASHGHSYDNFKVHIPNEAGLAKLRENGVDQTVTSSSNETATRPSQLPNIHTGVPNTQTIPPDQIPDHSNADSTTDIKPLTSVTQPQGPVNETSPVTQPQAPQEAAKSAPEQTAKVEPPKPAEAPKPAAPTPERYRVDTEKFVSAIKQTEDFKKQAGTGFLASVIPNSTIINGFNDDPRVIAAGVRLDEKGIMHFSKGMTPEAKEAMSTFDTKSFMTKIEEKKKEESKPATQVKAMAEGGKVPVNTEQITAYPIDGLRGDNAVVVNAQQKPLFTMNTNESVLMDPNNNRAEVIPDKKGTTVGPTPSKDMTSGIMEDFNSTIQEMKQDFANLKAAKFEPAKPPEAPLFQDPSWLAKSTQGSAEPYKSPTARRVAYRAHGMETGEPSSGFHYSKGNNS